MRTTGNGEKKEFAKELRSQHPSEDEVFKVVDRRRLFQDEDQDRKVADPKKEKEQDFNLQQTVDEEKERYLRLMADFDNFRKRAEEEKKKSFERGENEVFKNLFPLFDNLEKAYASAKAQEDYQAVIKGLEMILKMWQQILKQKGISETPESDEKFNPAFHQVLDAQESDAEEGTILAVYQKGYRRGDESLITAKVRVAKSIKKAPEEKEATDESIDTTDLHGS